MVMWIGAIEFDLRLGDVHSLKEKRSVVRPIIAEVRRRFGVSVAEVDHRDLHRRTAIGAAVVAADPTHLREVLDSIEHHVAGRPEIELLAAHRIISHSDDA